MNGPLASQSKIEFWMQGTKVVPTLGNHCTVQGIKETFGRFPVVCWRASTILFACCGFLVSTATLAFQWTLHYSAKNCIVLAILESSSFLIQKNNSILSIFVLKRQLNKINYQIKHQTKTISQNIKSISNQKSWNGFSLSFWALHNWRIKMSCLNGKKSWITKRNNNKLYF